MVPLSMTLSDLAEGFPLELGIGARGQKAQMMGLPDSRKSFKIGFCRLDTIPRVTDRQTDNYVAAAKIAICMLCVARVKT